MAQSPQLRIPATYMRGGTSKGIFFNLSDLPPSAQLPGASRDNLMMRIMGSPDPYNKQSDGMGGATSSTSKVVILSKSSRPDHDVDYLFGQVSIDSPVIDWSGNCGNLSAAAGSFAILSGLVNSDRIPQNGIFTVRIWQANIGKTLLVHIPITDYLVQEIGDFQLDGVAFPAAEIIVEFISPAGNDGSLFPTGNLVDVIELPPNIVQNDKIKATMINAAIPTIFINAEDIGYAGTELQEALNGDAKALAMFEEIRIRGSLRMGLVDTLADARKRNHTPKIVFISKAASYLSSRGVMVRAEDVDLLVRALSMGSMHHAMMGTAAVATGVAAAIPGTLVNMAIGGGERNSVCVGHPSGTLRVGAEVVNANTQWGVARATMSRSARVLMEGWIRVPSIL